MEHIFNIAINVEDDRIIRSIEKNVESQTIKMIAEKVEDIIYAHNYFGRANKNDDSPLKRMIEIQVEKMIDENKDVILESAAIHLADKLARSKAGRALLDQ